MHKGFLFAICLIVCFFIYRLPINPKLEYLLLQARGPTIHLATLESLLQFKDERFFSFSMKEAKNRLQSAAFLKQCKLQKVFPNKLKLIYTARLPIAFLGNVENVAFDAEGVLFPLYPHFTPMRLPDIYFDLDIEKSKPTQLSAEQMQLARQFLQKFLFGPFDIKTIDLRNIDRKLLGQREIAIHLVEADKIWVLRLAPEQWEKQIDLFLENKDFLQSQIAKDVSGYLVDLRLEQLAYISELSLSENEQL